VFTARYGLIGYIKQIAFRLYKVCFVFSTLYNYTEKRDMWHVWGRELPVRFTWSPWMGRPLEELKSDLRLIVKWNLNVRSVRCELYSLTWSVKERRNYAATSPTAVSGVKANWSIAGVFVSWNYNGSSPSVSDWSPLNWIKSSVFLKKKPNVHNRVHKSREWSPSSSRCV
jgi:hypothetical protein